jgi:putative transposase
MSKFKNTFRIESSRLKNWDYSNPWWYYITICAKGHKSCFGNIIDSKMILNELGIIANEEWKKTELLRAGVELDYYIIMPNHLHGIIIINGSEVETHRVRLGLAANDKEKKSYLKSENILLKIRINGSLRKKGHNKRKNAIGNKILW